MCFCQRRLSFAAWHQCNDGVDLALCTARIDDASDAAAALAGHASALQTGATRPKLGRGNHYAIGINPKPKPGGALDNGEASTEAPSDELPEQRADGPPKEPPADRLQEIPVDAPSEVSDPPELAACEEKLKRSLADYANLQRRTESEISTRVEDGVNSVLSDMLQVRDDFVRARDAYSAEGARTDGLDSVLKNMDALLEGRGVSAIEATGKPFDPALHEAVSSVPRPDMDEGTVVEEIRRGYRSRNRIIRPALVVVSTKDG